MDYNNNFVVRICYLLTNIRYVIAIYIISVQLFGISCNNMKPNYRIENSNKNDKDNLILKLHMTKILTQS